MATKQVPQAGKSSTPIEPDPSKPILVVRGSRRNETAPSGWDTTVCLFQGPKNADQLPAFLTGFVVVNGHKRNVIAHINERKPNTETGEIKPNFLVLSELVPGNSDDPQWNEVGHGNAINRRNDNKKVYFDELLFNVDGEILSARVTKNVGNALHRHLGFENPREARAERAAPKEPSQEADSRPPMRARG